MKRNNLIILLTTMFISMVINKASAYDALIDGIYYELHEFSRGNEATVVSGDNQYYGDVIIPQSVTYNGKIYDVICVGPWAFYNCTDLTSIIIPESITDIDNAAFKDCSCLTSITIPNSVTNIRNGAFSGCCNLTTITIPNSITKIDDEAFYDCIGLTSMVIPEGVTDIGISAFHSCSNLESVTLPESLNIIENSAFYGCKSLTSIVIPNNVTSIAHSAFEHCDNMTSIKLPDGITSIQQHCFQFCYNLPSITIPSSVTNIEEYAFISCYSLSAVKCKSESPADIASLTFERACIDTLYVPRGSKVAYQAADNWKDFKEIIEFNYVDVDKMSIESGKDAQFEIGLNNDYEDIVAFQMDITLPEGVGIDKDGCSLSSRITDNEQYLTVGKLENGSYRLTSTSFSLTPISGNDSTLLTLKLTAADGCVGGKATISNIQFATANSELITMQDESFDINVIYKLNYKVDGEVYKTYDIVYNTQSVFESEPTKEGYTFGGWGEIPETMPNHDVEVTGQFYLYGDVNTDDEVDVVDVVDIARFVVATPSEMFREKLADLNNDLMVNIADAVVLINYIVGNQNFVKAELPSAKSYDYDQCQLHLVSREANTLSLDFIGESDFTAMQFEMDLPQGVDVSAIRVNAQRLGGHQLIYNKVSENRYRVAVLSLSNDVFKGNDGELLKISLNEQPNADISINEVHFVTTNATDVKYDGLSFDGSTTGIDIPSVKTDNIMLYDLQGRRRNLMQRGVNIVNGQKIIRR